MLTLLIRYRARLVFVTLFVALSVASMQLPGNGATDHADIVTNASSTAAASRCGVYTCLPEPVKQTPAEVAQAVSKWGKPISEQDFDTPLDTGVDGGWDIYDDPNGSSRREAGNVVIKDGFLDLQGTYKNGRNSGAGLSQRVSQKYGRWEVRARADVGRGFSPTILLWPDNENWPAGGEIDLLESPHGNREKGIAVVHNGSGNNFKSQGLVGSQSDWHTYAVDWEADHITFYVDDVEQWTVTDPKLIPTTSSMHLALQNDAGCGWIECPNKTTKPVTSMQVDWIKVYALPAS